MGNEINEEKRCGWCQFCTGFGWCTQLKKLTLVGAHCDKYEKKKEQEYWLYWCGSCSGSIRESPHIQRLPADQLPRHLCDCCGKYYAIWAKKVPRGDYFNAHTTYTERQNRAG